MYYHIFKKGSSMAKENTVCFKVDAATAEAMRGIPNRSDFLRSAVLAALANTCPVCRGTGHLTPRQMAHWRGFAENHAFRKCGECEEFHWVCMNAPGNNVHKTSESASPAAGLVRKVRPAAKRTKPASPNK
jgi:hypothetical protein